MIDVQFGQVRDQGVRDVATVGQPRRYLTAGPLAGKPARHHRTWAIVTAIEVVLACVTVVVDLAIPTFVLLGLAAVSLLIRRTGLASLGFHRVASLPLAVKMLVFAGTWSAFQLAVTMPIASHVSGKKTDLSDFNDLRGNFGMLLGLLLLTWTVAAVGEELAYRGYVQTRLRDLFGSGRLGLVIAVVVSSVLFGTAHSEQGVIGALTITLDGLAFSVVRYRYKSLWASVLAHGFNNTIGFLAFFLCGPTDGFW
jgi:membrane protease YdiL (CAAX protease family)